MDLRLRMGNGEISEINTSCKSELEEILDKEGDIVKSWHKKAKIGESLSIPKICTEHKNNEETLYFLHKSFRNRFENVWTHVENGEFIIKKVSKEEFIILNNKHSLEEETIDNLLGFTKVFRLLAAMKKPLVGHNVLQDLLLLVSSFDSSLPDSYTDFKKLFNDLFPTVFDTRTLSYELRTLVPEQKRWIDKGKYREKIILQK